MAELTEGMHPKRGGWRDQPPPCHRPCTGRGEEERPSALNEGYRRGKAKPRVIKEGADDHSEPAEQDVAQVTASVHCLAEQMESATVRPEGAEPELFDPKKPDN